MIRFCGTGTGGVVNPTRVADDPKSPDVALVCGKTEDGEGVRILRARDGAIEAGELRAVREGGAIHGELLRLHPQSEAPWLCNVEVLYKPEKPENHEGPTKSADAAAASPRPQLAPSAPRNMASDAMGHAHSRVPNRAYRTNWDRIFQGERDGADDRDPPPPSSSPDRTRLN